MHRIFLYTQVLVTVGFRSIILTRTQKVRSVLFYSTFPAHTPLVNGPVDVVG